MTYPNMTLGVSVGAALAALLFGWLANDVFREPENVFISWVAAGLCAATAIGFFLVYRLKVLPTVGRIRAKARFRYDDTSGKPVFVSGEGMVHGGGMVLFRKGVKLLRDVDSPVFVFREPDSVDATLSSPGFGRLVRYPVPLPGDEKLAAEVLEFLEGRLGSVSASEQ